MFRACLILAAPGALLLAACASAGPQAPHTDITAVAAGDIPAEASAVVLAAQPGLRIAEAELKQREGRRYYDVEGTLPDGREIELDLLERDGRWVVVEIQRDLPWASVPAEVRAAARPRWRGPEPVRVIESRQAEGVEVIYELFAQGQPATPALEVMVKDGRASVLKEVWPH